VKELKGRNEMNDELAANSMFSRPRNIELTLLARASMTYTTRNAARRSRGRCDWTDGRAVQGAARLVLLMEARLCRWER